MARPLCALLLAAVLVPASQAAFIDPLPGEYYNVSNGRACAVYADGRSYIFVNENGDRARFVYIAPGELGIIGRTNWNPNTRAYPDRDGFGRSVITFKEPGGSPGLWAAR